ncbi:MAG: hypothetical protein IJJ43_06345 [Oscillospiraceae bacterium]|nr:hypothetical protein [Oscillospiraceae bacterium]MBQ6465868.1 hypothetical protein [Oscillospiraceae bacterium]
MDDKNVITYTKGEGQIMVKRSFCNNAKPVSEAIKDVIIKKAHEKNILTSPQNLDMMLSYIGEPTCIQEGG